MPTKTKSEPTWEDICLAVEKLIDGKTVETEHGQGVTRIRQFRFRDFATAVGFDIGQCHRSIRGSSEPSVNLEIAVRKWVKENQ